jgi:transposase-like protein
MRAMRIPSPKRPHITEVIKAHVNPGSFLMTDALNSYKHLGEDGFIHMMINHAVKYAEGRIHTISVENFWSLLGRALNGTYVAVEPFHLDAYVDEQCFRFNNRKMTDADRMVLVVAGIGGKRLTYAELTRKIAGEQRCGIPPQKAMG